MATLHVHPKEQKEVLWRHICNDLKSQMRKYSFNDPFYTLNDICAKYNVSQITARRVQAELEREGLVKRIRRRGTVVQKIQEPLSVTMVLPAQTTVDLFLAEPSTRSIYRTILLLARKWGVEFEVVSERYLSSTMVNNNGMNNGRKEGVIALLGIKEETLKFLQTVQIPVVLISYVLQIAEFSCVLVDLKKAGYLATRHLVELGHRRIGFINGDAHNAWFFPRLKGYRKALREGGVRFDRRLVKETSGRVASEDVQAFRDLLNLSNPPTAIFTANDYRAIHVIDYCREKGIRIPADMSIVGLDNTAESSRVLPPLTTVDMRYDRIGEESLALLLKKLQGKGKECPGKIAVTPEFIARSSTAGLSLPQQRVTS